MHLQNGRCFHEHMRMLLHSLRQLCLASGGLGASKITWEYRCGLWECLGGLHVAAGPIYILLMKVELSLSISPYHHHELTLSAAYTECSIHRVQHTPSAAYTECSIHRVQHTPSAAYTEFSIHPIQHTPSTAYTKYSIHRVQHTPSTAYTEWSIHGV